MMYFMFECSLCGNIEEHQLPWEQRNDQHFFCCGKEMSRDPVSSDLSLEERYKAWLASRPTGDQDCKGLLNIGGYPTQVRGRDHFNKLCKQRGLFAGSDEEGKQHAAFKKRVNEESHHIRAQREAKSLAEQMAKDGVIKNARKALIEDKVLIKGLIKS